MAMLISLAVFVFASTAQAGEADPRVSPLESPLITARAARQSKTSAPLALNSGVLYSLTFFGEVK